MGMSEQMIFHVQQHGYGINRGTQMVVLINPLDFDLSGMPSWRANVEVRTGVRAKHDFIPSALSVDIGRDDPRPGP